MNSQFKFKVGDIVQVVNQKRVFSFFDRMADFFGIWNWAKGRIPYKDRMYLVKDINFHLSFKTRVLVYIEEVSSPFRGYIMNQEGLRLDREVIPDFFINDDDFSL